MQPALKVLGVRQRMIGDDDAIWRVGSRAPRGHVMESASEGFDIEAGNWRCGQHHGYRIAAGSDFPPVDNKEPLKDDTDSRFDVLSIDFADKHVEVCMRLMIRERKGSPIMTFDARIPVEYNDQLSIYEACRAAEKILTRYIPLGNVPYLC
jgi:hypothetical protein